MNEKFTIENGDLHVDISSRGAELTRIYSKSTKLDYLWNGDPAYWAKHSPVLFPIVGALKNNTYTHNGQSFTLPRHGFAREKTFAVTEQTQSAITFCLTDDAATAKVYPFAFRFDIIYSIDASTLTTRYRIVNPAKHELLFSVGGHPAFRVPLMENESYNDYFLEFEKEEFADRWLITSEGLISNKREPVLTGGRRLPVTRELFYRDALVFKHIESTSVRLVGKGPHGIGFTFHNFPYLGIWATKDAHFVCMEPWCGIADATDHDQQLKNKEGMIKLAASETFERAWTVELF